MSASASAAPAAAPRLDAVPDKVDFAAEEQKVQERWEKIQAFETSLKQSEGKPIYTFYDGPPFATGLPHYGHILAGTIKDVVTRYAHQTGHHVVRRFGWDTHGLPVEHEIDQKLGIKSKEDVMKMGIGAYNDECRAIVTRYTREWEATVKRMGRWIDFKNDYKTMDVTFMESVWWVFSQLWEKGLVYRGYKVMPYSIGCTTPLSNFEAGLNYKDVSDPAVYVTFPMLNVEPRTSFVAWTTTPWTLPSNLALAVNSKFTYLKVKDLRTGELLIVGKTRLLDLYPPKKGAKKEAAPAAAAAAAASAGSPPPSASSPSLSKAEAKKEAAAAAAAAVSSLAQKTDDYEILEEFPGSQLVGARYQPIFDDFAGMAETNGAFRVIHADYVTDDSGTGIVHQAPGFGEDDYNSCAAQGIIQRDAEVLCPVDANGRFTADVKDFKGVYVKDADRDIIAMLKKNGRMIKQQQLVHSYPFCWRSETPLIYRAVPSWFVRVERIKADLLAANAQTYWVPDFVKEKRFHNWLTDARDWAVSRNRYWGTPLPIWMSADGKEMRVMGSIEQLRELSGEKSITDLHKDKIDHITIPDPRGAEFPPMRRVEEVFDCWFESGSMPYAQLHYPFENQSYFANGFPADFIAEGLDQTRGWFYTLMVISTGLFNKPAFKNLIVNGLVLAADGKKMSKRLKNYPDPLLVVSRYGADALRLYLINSPVVRAEPLRFQESGVHDVVKQVCLPWFHAYRFFVENALRYEKENGTPFQADGNGEAADGSSAADANVMDQWILSALQSLTAFVHTEMAAYRLYTVVPRLLTFIDALTNWYVRMNRGRLKGKYGVAESRAALHTLFNVLLSLCKLMAPFTPFFVDYMYSNLRRVLPKDAQLDCVHYAMLPVADAGRTHADVERRVSRMQTVIELGRTARDKAKLTMKRPLKSALVVHADAGYLADVRALQHYVRDELNCRVVEFSSEVDKFILLKATPNRKALGSRLGAASAAVARAVSELTHAQLLRFQSEGSVEVNGHKLTAADLDVSMNFQGDHTRLMDCGNNDALVIINIEEDPTLMAEAAAREITRRVQQLRKEAGLVPTDDVEVFFEFQQPAGGKAASSSGKTSALAAAMQTQQPFIRETLGRDIFPAAHKPAHALEVARGELALDGEVPLTLVVTRMFVSCDADAIAQLPALADRPQHAQQVAQFLAQKEWTAFRAQCAMKADFACNIDGRVITLTAGKHFFFTVREALDAQRK